MNSFKKFLSILISDFHWKMLALAAAFVIWLWGMHMSDPYRNMSVTVRLQLDSLEIMARDNIMILNEDALRDINVSVTLRALRSDIYVLQDALADAERFSEIINASVDFRAISTSLVEYADGISTQRLRVGVNLAPGFEHLTVSPAYVDVELDTLIRQMFSVRTLRRGEVPPGFELQNISLGNNAVTVTGSRTDIGMISSVQTIVDVSAVHEEVEFSAPLRVMNVYGYDMTERVNLSVTETTAFVRVWPVRTVDFFVRGAGEPAYGFALAEVSGGPETVEVVGSAEALDELEYVLAEMDLSGLMGNVTRTLYISEWLPEGVYLRYGEYDEHRITARIEQLEERIFIVPLANVFRRGLVGGGYQLVDEVSPIRLNISGPRSLIAALNANDITPELDLRGLAIGIHSVQLYVELPDGLSLVGATPTLMVQIHEPFAGNGNNDEPPVPYVPVPLPYPYPYDENGEENGEENGDENGYENGGDDPYEYPQGADDEDYYGEGD